MTSELFRLMNHFHTTREQFKANHEDNTLTLIGVPNTPPNIERIEYECQQLLEDRVKIKPLDPSDNETDILITIKDYSQNISPIL